VTEVKPAGGAFRHKNVSKPQKVILPSSTLRLYFGYPTT
jgi:hypothetical protein